MEEFQASCSRMTVLVVIDQSGRVIETAPITRKFVGQTLGSLRRWMERIGGDVRLTKLGELRCLR